MTQPVNPRRDPEPGPLQALGLAAAEAALYEAVVLHPGCSGTDAAALTHLTETRTRQGLARLNTLGLVSRSAGRDATYHPTPPDSALTALVHQRENELAAARSSVRRINETYQQTAQRQHDAGLVEVVTGTEAITRISWQLINGATEQIRWFERPPYPNDPPNALLGAERNTLARGIPERMIFASAGLRLPGRFDEVAEMARLGQQIRVLPELPVKMGIIDSRLAILPVITPSHTNDAAYLVHPSSLLEALSALFEDHWTHALPFSRNASLPTAEEVEEADELISASDRKLLALLAAGHTDASIARATGTGLRTVQRHIHDIMEKMHVITRFQAGIVARDKGWLP